MSANENGWAQAVVAPDADDQVTPVVSNWEVSIDEGKTWLPIAVPGTIEDQIDVNFDGISQYRCHITPPTVKDAESRVVLRFHAVATHATVYLNGDRLGEHLGGWTPFEFDVTDRLRNEAKDWELVVRCDERVGHNTQGFLPIVAPHFSGIWKPVELVVTRRRIGWDLLRSSDSELSVSGTAKRVLTLRGRVDGWKPDDELQLAIEGLPGGRCVWRLTGGGRSAPKKGAESSPSIDVDVESTLRVDDDGYFGVEFVVPDAELWSPESPRFYDLTVSLTGHRGARPIRQTTRRRVGFRTVAVDGTRLLINGRPTQVRGVLNWGVPPSRLAYAGNPPNGFWWEVAPTLDENVMRREIERAQAMGFNLMKFCLWVPPKRYLELCDEMGMLAWMEYPTWHPDFSAERLPELLTEFDEFFEYVRAHPCIVLHSLTCETGPGADIEVIRALYQRCKQQVPGAIVEDDSSWIEWNRIHDFYDDHPYGNNHTWVATLRRLRDYIAAREAKPLILGEAIAADTWVSPEDLATPEQLTRGTPLEWPMPDFLAGNARWMAKINSLYGQSMLGALSDDSRRYAFLMRKYQIETYRREVPDGGYVVSAIRDIRKTSMGLIDYRDRLKWPAEQWAWHGDSTLILKTKNDARSFMSGEAIELEVLLSRFRQPHESDRGTLVARLLMPDNMGTGTGWVTEQRAELTAPSPGDGATALGRLRWPCPDVTCPTRMVVEVTWTEGERVWKNQWPVWGVPKTADARPYQIYAAGDVDLSRIGLSAEQLAGDMAQLLAERLPEDETTSGAAASRILIARRFDPQVIQCLSRAHVLLLPDNSRRSFPTAEHWFLRGGPVPSRGRCFDLPQVPTQMLVELQHFDLAGPVVPHLQYLDQLEPVLLLWDNHDLDHVRTHGVAFELNTPRGGRVLVTTANHASAAGRWVLDQWLRRLVSDEKTQPAARIAMEPSFWEDLVAEITDQKIDLTQLEWRFRPEHHKQEAARGVAQGWHEPDFPDRNWATIRIDRHWEGQGEGEPWKALDGWAWYRRKVDIPADWNGASTYLNFTGVDDHFRVFVNGHEVGSGGDIPTRSTAFDARLSFDISEFVKPGGSVTIAVAVYDWYGAGGIFRPVILSHRRMDKRPPVLK